MRKTIWTGMFVCVFGFATATALIAQAPTAQQPETQSDKNTIVTGCLRAAPSSSADATATTGVTGRAGATGTAGTAGTATGAQATGGDVTEQKFMLTDAAAGADPSASVNTSGATTPGTARLSYRLIANPAALSPHVGKKLELTGTLEDPNVSTKDSTSGAEVTLPTLRVVSGKIVAASCDEK